MAVAVSPIVGDLVERAQADPAGVQVAASELLRHATDDVAIVARWARGLARRELGQLDGAQEDLTVAVHLATAAGDAGLAAQVKVSLAAVVQNRGDTDGAHALLDEAEAHAAGGALGRLWMQRALLRHREGAMREAEREYERALPLLIHAHDRLAEARLRLNLGLVQVQLGRRARGEAHLRAAHELAVALDQRLLAAMALHNLGYLLAREGDAASALGTLDEAEHAFAALGDDLHVALVKIDRSLVLSQVGLTAEASADAHEAVELIATGGNVNDLGEAALVAAEAAIAAGDAAAGHELAGRALDAFAGAGREAWRLRGELTLLLASDLAGDVGTTEAVNLVDRLADAGWTAEAASAAVIACRRLAATSSLDDAARLLDRVSGSVGSGVDRIALELARAELRQAAGDRAGARRSVSAGLRRFRENQAALGSLELRAHASHHGERLAHLGMRLALDEGRPRELLARSEELRGINAVLPRARPPEDAALGSLLASLRDAKHRETEAHLDGRPATAERAEREAIERRVRSHVRRSLSQGDARRVTVDELIEGVGSAVVLSYVELDGQLIAATVRSGRVRAHRLGPSASVSELLDHVDLSLLRLHRRQMSETSRRAASEALVDASRLLADRLVPSEAAGEAPIVVIPAGRLHGLPWRILDGWATRQVVVAPSMTAHLIASGMPAIGTGVMTVGGPDLAWSGEEVANVARQHRTAIALAGPDATVEGTCQQLSQAALAHFACHGTYRGDNPLFSSLRLADGDLTVYDLERCARLPHTMVLSACNAAQSTVLRGGALLGLSSALVQLGVSSVIAPLTPVNDERSVDVMVRLHMHLAAGRSPAEALALASVVDGELDPTAASFVCMGS